MSNRNPGALRASEGEADVAPGFAAILRERTSAIHREAERIGFIADLIRGRATLAGYALFLHNLSPVYEALEEAIDARANQDAAGFEVLAPFAERGLRRLDALRADLRSLGAGVVHCATLPEAADYAQAVRAASGDERLVAHGYARYLGDLSGGQILKPVLARTLGLPPEALSFYDFPAIPNLVALKAAMREALDRVDASGPMAAAIVQEAIAAFRHNIALSQAVQGSAG